MDRHIRQTHRQNHNHHNHHQPPPTTTNHHNPQNHNPQQLPRAGLCGISLLGLPRGGGGRGEEDQVDSFLRSSSTPAVADAGLVWLVASRALFPVIVCRPEMLRIMAGMHQKGQLPEAYRQLDYLGDDFTMFPNAAQCLDFSVTCYASAYGVLVIFNVPLSDSHLFGVRQWSTRLWIFREMPSWFISVFSSCVGSTLDTCLRQYMVQTANCGVSAVAVLFLVVDIPFVTQRLFFWVCSADLSFHSCRSLTRCSMSLLCRSTCRPCRDAEADPHGPSLQKNIVIPIAVH